MSCSEVTELIQLYLDDELDARDTLNVQRHLESCSACSHVLDGFMEQDRLLKEAARAAATDSCSVRLKILSAIRRETQASRSRWVVPVAWRRVAAIVALATVTGLLLLKGGFLPGINENVYAAIASDHADHCSIGSRVGATTDRQELDRLSATYGKLNSTPDLSAFGYVDPFGRTCKVSGTVFLHLVYHRPDRQALSVFVRAHSSGLVADDLTNLQQAGYKMTSLSKSGIDLLVVTSLGDQEAAVIAQTIAAKL